MSAVSMSHVHRDQVVRFSRLDAQMIKPYAWSLLLPLVVVFPLAWAEPVLLVSITPILVAMMASSFVFSLDEASGLELLHVLLPGAKQSAVLGRYLILALVLAATLAGSILLAVGGLLAGRGQPSGFLAVVASGACTALIFLSVQMPLFFRFGYMRARFWGYAAFLVLSGIFGAMIMVFPQAALFMFTGVMPVVLVLAALAVFAASACLSVNLVQRREV